MITYLHEKADSSFLHTISVNVSACKLTIMEDIFLLTSLFTQSGSSYFYMFSGILFSAIISFFLFYKYKGVLPVDHGRAFAVDGNQSKGKPTGAGVFIVIAYIISSLLFLPIQIEFLLYYVLVFSAMLAGFLDDRAKEPWNEYKKGFLDLCISIVAALTFTLNNDLDIYMPLLGISVQLPFPIYLILAIILVWISINVTNCTDGIDGLSSSLIMTTLSFFFLITVFFTETQKWNTSICILLSVLLVYLCFNTNPSQLLMGDAGSRALGVFLAITAMQSKAPLTILVFALIIILDGSAGMLKIFMKRFLKISILKKTITPFHDHFKKNFAWSIPQITVRFTIVQFILCVLYFLLTCLLHHDL